MGWRRYLPTARERGEWRGLLSTYAEYHSLGIGLGIGVVAAALAQPALMGSVALIAVGEAEAQGEQLHDVGKEPALALVGLAVGYLVVGALLNPVAIERLGRLADGVGQGVLAGE